MTKDFATALMYETVRPLFGAMGGAAIGIVVADADADAPVKVLTHGIINDSNGWGGELTEGTVIAVGDGMYSTTGTLIPVIVKEGNKILYHQHGGIPEYKLDGETVYIMSQNEVLSIVEE